MNVLGVLDIGLSMGKKKRTFTGNPVKVKFIFYLWRGGLRSSRTKKNSFKNINVFLWVRRSDEDRR